MLKYCTCPPHDCREMVRRCLGGDESAKEELYVRFQPMVFTIVRRVLGSAHACNWDDVCQDVFARLFLKLGTWAGRSPFCAWLGVVASRVAIDAARASLWVGLDDPAAIEDRRSNARDPALIECIETTVAGFGPAWRAVLDLLVEGVKPGAIASTLGKDRKTIYNWIVQMRERLDRCVTD